MDIFEDKNISPMLIAENKPPFDDNGFIYELKLDGIRCLAYLDEVLGVSRNDFKIISSAEQTGKNFYINFPDYEGAVWIMPKLVCRFSLWSVLVAAVFVSPFLKDLEMINSRQSVKLVKTKVIYS